jgi:uncharacterized protein YbjQ (UPF0145 family)
MKMKITTAVLLVAVGLAWVQPSARHSAMNDMTAATYEHLASAIIEIRATEDGLVKGMLLHAHGAATNQLEAAMRGRNRTSHLERAAAEITTIANEGNKEVQAVRQRLLKAGHHHHTDAETQEDYMFIDSGEKRALLDLARKVSKLGADADESDIRQVMTKLDAVFQAAIAPE